MTVQEYIKAKQQEKIDREQSAKVIADIDEAISIMKERPDLDTPEIRQAILGKRQKALELIRPTGKVDTAEFFTKQYDVAQSIPFVPTKDTRELVFKIVPAVVKIKKGERLSLDEDLALQDWYNEQETNAERGRTIAADAWNIITSMPAYMGEFAAGKAVIGNAAKAGGVKLVESILKSYAQKGLGKFAAKSAGVLASGAAMAATTGAGMSYTSAARNYVNTEDSALKSAYKGFVDAWAENTGEQTGGAMASVFGKITKKVLPRGSKLYKAIATVDNAAIGKKAGKFLEKVGYNGTLEEMGEERFSAMMRAVLGTGEFSEVLPSGKQLATEAIAFAVPGAVGGGLQSIDAARNSVKERTYRLSYEGASDYADKNPQEAAYLAGIQSPSRTDFEKVGLKGYNQQQRQQFADLMRKFEAEKLVSIEAESPVNEPTLSTPAVEPQNEPVVKEVSQPVSEQPIVPEQAVEVDTALQEMRQQIIDAGRPVEEADATVELARARATVISRQTGKPVNDIVTQWNIDIKGTPKAEVTQKVDEIIEPAETPAIPERKINYNAKLPAMLTGAKPQYGYRDKRFTLTWSSDIDKAFYITGQKTKSKRDKEYRKFLKDNGFTNAEIDTIGQQVRDNIKATASKRTKSGNIVVPNIAAQIFKPKPVKKAPAEKTADTGEIVAKGIRAAKDLGGQVPQKLVNKADKALQERGLAPIDKKVNKANKAYFKELFSGERKPLSGDTYTLPDNSKLEVSKVGEQLPDGSYPVEVNFIGKKKGRVFDIYADGSKWKPVTPKADVPSVPVSDKPAQEVTLEKKPWEMTVREYLTENNTPEFDFGEAVKSDKGRIIDARNDVKEGDYITGIGRKADGSPKYIDGVAIKVYKQKVTVKNNEGVFDVADKIYKLPPKSIEYLNARQQHINSIKQAIREGNLVPLNVLQDYKGEQWADEAISKLETSRKAPESKISEPIVSDEGAKVKYKPESSKQEPEKSKGHVAFFNAPNGTQYELYKADNGDLYRAPVSSVIDLDTGNRHGRWETKASMADETAARILAPEQETAPTVKENLTVDKPKPVTEEEADAEPVVYVKISDIKLSKDVPQFKENADPTSGVVKGERLTGKYKAFPVNPIVLWERLNGDLEVITGRHRLDLARQNKMPRIAATIKRERDGFTVIDALTLDAEANIMDEKGSVKDYAKYFRNTNYTRQQAEQEGLLSRTKGRTGFEIGRGATDGTYSAFLRGEISESKAAAIAEAAPMDEDVQSVAVLKAKDMNADELREFVTILKRTKPSDIARKKAKQGNLFGFDDSAIQEAELIAKEISKEIRATKERILSVKGALKRPKQAQEMGLGLDNQDNIKSEVDRLENWLDDLSRVYTTPSLMKMFRERAGLAVTTETVTPQEEIPVEVEQGKRLFQSAQSDKRGEIEFTDNGAVITLLQNADASTLPHELAHFFLRDMAKSTTEQVKADMAIIRKWLNNKGGNFTTEQEERFARAFEAYLRKGKAPTTALQRVFDNFKAWLSQVYKKATDLKVVLSPEIAGVFDRMLGAENNVLNQSAAEAGASPSLVEKAKAAWLKLGTESPYFKAWFGKSKVVDENGKPLVVYHGTADKITEFNAKERGRTTAAESAKKGFFFTKTKSLAAQYSQFARPAKLDKLKNEADRLEKIAKKTNNNADWRAYEKAYVKYEKAELSYSEIRDNAENIVEVYLSIKNPLVHDFKGEVYRDESYSDLIDKAIANGNDGVILKNTYDGTGDINTIENPLTDVYIAFSPSQIKSVSNQGTFEADNPNILNQSAVEEPDTEQTSAKNKFTEEQMRKLTTQMFGDNIPNEQTKHYGDVIQNAVDKEYDKNALDIADTVLSKGIILNDEQVVGLSIRALELSNQRHKALLDIAATTDAIEKEMLMTQYNRIEADMAKIYNALNVTGTDTARALSVRRIMIDNANEWTLPTLLAAAEAKKGKPLTEKEVDNTTNWYNKYVEKSKELDAVVIELRKEKATNIGDVISKVWTRNMDKKKAEQYVADKESKLAELLKKGCYNG